MRRVLFVICLLLAVSLSITNGFAADLRIKVVDPRNEIVNRARIAVYPTGATTAAAIQNTSGDGVAVIRGLGSGEYRVQVLAPGFAAQTVSVALPQQAELNVQLRIATSAETVDVTATRTPLPADESAADVNSLSAEQITTMNPVAAGEALRFLPGAIVNDQGQRGGQTSLFVRGGESRYNKVIIDDVAVNDPGGSFDFGVLPLEQVDRLEFLRGPQSTLYGSDAMTSVVQVWTRNGSTRIPDFKFGADGGNLATAHGYASLSGARGRVDYNLFGDQFNTQGLSINDDYSNAAQGANVGVELTPQSFLRFRTRHSNSRSGLPGEWNFNGQPLLPPDSDARSRQNNFLASAEFTVAAPSRWQHRFVGFEYNHRYDAQDTFTDPGRIAAGDFPFHSIAHNNRTGMEYQGDYWERTWARSTFGYRFEDENGFVGDLTFPPVGHGLRRNHAVYGEQVFVWSRVSLIGGMRFEHNESFGNKAVPRVAATLLARRGGDFLSGTRLRFNYAEGIMEPRLEEAFGIGGFGILPNPNLKPEQNRSLEAGVQQNFFGTKLVATANYYNNLFRNRIDFNSVSSFTGQYVNVNKDLAHGAELQLDAHPWSRLKVTSAYTYTSTQILTPPLCAVFGCNPLLAQGAPLLRRPRHAGTLLASWLGNKWGGTLGGTFIGRRPDSDFLFGAVPPVTSAAGYARIDVGAWRQINSRMTAYINVENALNKHYEQVVGYPALRANFRAGMRFRLGGE